MLPYAQKIIRIHRECPCKIGKSHPGGRNFEQGRGLPSPWLKFLPRGLDFPILHGLAHGGLFFLPPLSGLFLEPAGLRYGHVRYKFLTWAKSLSHTGKGVRNLLSHELAQIFFFPFISDMPFPIFIRSILIYTRRHGSLRDLRYELIDMLREYKDCVKACEHQHSKRSGQFSKSYVYPVQPREIICKYTDPGDTRGGSRKISEGVDLIKLPSLTNSDSQA